MATRGNQRRVNYALLSGPCCGARGGSPIGRARASADPQDEFVDSLTEGQLAEFIAGQEMGSWDPDVIALERFEAMRQKRAPSKNTRPERLLQRALKKKGLRYRLHVKMLPGTPDLAFYGRARLAVFVDGDFFHGNPDLPKTRRVRWVAENRRRDAHITKILRGKGWAVLRRCFDTVRTT